MIGISLEFVASLIEAVPNGISIHNVGLIIFHTVCLVGKTLFFKLARKWSSTINYWYDAEYLFFQMPYNLKKGWKLSSIIRLVGITMIIISLGRYKD